MGKNILLSMTLCLLIITLIFGVSQLNAQSDIWVTAYYAGWQQGYLPPQSIDYTAMTHITHFALVPNANGTLDDQVNGVTAANASAIISSAHAAGKKVLIAVGGWATESAFMSATTGATRAIFVSNLVNLMRTRGYDGIDIDWEPLNSGNAANYTAFVTELRTALNAITPRPLLTMATQWTAPISATVASQMDQINLMTYDLAGAWPGWVVWHNSATYDGGVTIGSQMISADGMVNQWNAAGVPLNKLGIGIDFYGYVWSGGTGTTTGGATAPAQSWTTAPSVQGNVPYSTIMSNYYQSGNYRWDANSQASYLSIDNTGSANDKFITYDDEATVTAKINYARNKHIGGVIIWELGGGYRSSMPSGQRDLLLQTVKQAIGGTSTVDATLPAVSITAPASGASVLNTITVSASASDNVGVAGVQFKLDGNNLGSEITSAPYNVSWNTALAVNGTHTLTATARDAAGNTKVASISVTVSNPVTDTTPPTVSFTAPANGTTVSGTLSIGANATDNVGVVGVQFKLDGNNLGSEITSAPYNVSWNTTLGTNGSHTITAIARDAAGNTKVAPTSVTVSNLGTDTTPPTILITFPLAGTTVPSIITIGANASDNVGVVGVQFKLDGNNLGNEIASAPYAYSWNTTSVANGSHSITATARDASGNQSTASVTISVFNTVSTSSDMQVYQEALQSPWLDNSWSTKVTFNSMEQKYAGTNSIKVVQNKWGALSIRSGNWHSSVPVSPSLYQSVEFAVYGGASGITLGVMFENDAANTFPRISYGTIPANTWKVVSIPMSQLNPNNYVIHRLDIMDITETAKTYYVDNIRFVGKSAIVAPSVPSTPLLSSPMNGATAIPSNPTLNWNASSGAVSYRVQVSMSSTFSTTTVDQSGITTISRMLSGLSNNAVYYWRVNATNTAGTSGWSSVSSFTTLTTAVVTDTTRPAVSFIAPVTGTTVSGTLSISANATDNVKVAGVQFKLDGNNLGSEIVSAPYTYSWNTTSATNALHTVTATARDSAGNQATATISVTVSNAVASSSDLWTYQEALQSPWINNSWNATVTFNSTEQKYAGTNSIKVVQGTWGGLSMLNGNWGSLVPVNPSLYQSVECAVYGGTSGITLGVMFENGAANSFPRIDYGTIPANTWKVVTIPMSQLNPNNYVIHRLNIMEMSGVAKTYYVDNIRFVGKTTAAVQKPAEVITSTPDKIIESTPKAFTLAQNYPNPFNPSTTIKYTLPLDAHVSIEVYNTIGQSVASLVNETQGSGDHEIFFSASELPSGVYFYRLTARSASGGQEGTFVETKRMILTK